MEFGQAEGTGTKNIQYVASIQRRENKLEKIIVCCGYLVILLHKIVNMRVKISFEGKLV